MKNCKIANSMKNCLNSKLKCYESERDIICDIIFFLFPSFLSPVSFSKAILK